MDQLLLQPLLQQLQRQPASVVVYQQVVLACLEDVEALQEVVEMQPSCSVVVLVANLEAWVGDLADPYQGAYQGPYQEAFQEGSLVEPYLVA